MNSNVSYLDTYLSTSQTRKIIPKLWGYEEIIINEQGYCGKLLHYNGKAASSLHYHRQKDEVLYVLKGVFKLELNTSPFASPRNELSNQTTQTILSEVNHDAIHLRSGVAHRLIPVGEGIILEFSSHDSPLDCVRLEESKLL